MTSGLVVVIGGGISGLGAAYALRRAGAEVRLLEGGGEVGGVIRSELADGFLIEEGPTSALNNSCEVEAVIGELGLLPERIFASTASRKRYIAKNGRLVPLPMNPLAFATTPLWTARAKWGLLGEPFARSPTGEESIAAFVRRRLGDEFLDYAVDPFVSGVYAGDPEALSLPATFPRLAALERDHGSLIRGALAGLGRRRTPRPARRGIYSFTEGLGQLVQALASHLGEAIWRQSRVTRIDRRPSGYRLAVHRAGHETWVEARRVVVATSADAAAHLLRPLAPALGEDLSAIPYASVAVVCTAFSRQDVAHPLDGFGCLVPAREGLMILGSLWTSSVFRGRAPEGTVLLTTFVGGARHPELVTRSDDALIELACTNLDRLVGARGTPCWTRVIRHTRAIPQYVIGHPARVARIEHGMGALPGMFLAGNYLRGVAVGDCLARGVDLGRRLGR